MVFDGGESGSKVYGGNELWLKAVSDLEWGLFCSAICSDVVGKFGKWEQVCPVILLEVTEDMEELFNFLVYVFGFAVCLWVKGCGERRFDA